MSRITKYPLHPYILTHPPAEEVTPAPDLGQVILQRELLHAPELLIPRRTVARQLLQVDWRHPMTKGLAAFFLPGVRQCLASGLPVVPDSDRSDIQVNRAYGGRRMFWLPSASTECRISIDLGEHPRYDFTSFAGPVSMCCNFFLDTLNATGQGLCSMNHNSINQSIRVTAQTNVAGDPIRTAIIEGASTKLEVDNDQPYTADSWHFAGLTCGGDNDLNAYIDRYAPTQDTVGTLAGVQYDEFAIGSWATTGADTWRQPTGGGFTYAAMWVRKLSTAEMFEMERDPFQFLKPA